MDTSCYEEVNEEVHSVDIIEVLSLVLTSGLIDFDNYGVLHMSSGVREATIIIIIIIISHLARCRYAIEGTQRARWAGSLAHSP